MRILVIRLSSLGDVILTQPVVASLRERYPQAEIVFLTKAAYAPLPGLFGAEVKTALYRKNLKWHLQLRRERFDLVIDLQAKLSSWLVKTLARGTKKATYDKRRKLRLHIVKGDRQAAVNSVVNLYLTALDKLFGDGAGSGESKPPRLDLSRLGPMEIDLPPREGDKRLIGLFVGAAHATKAYPTDQWREFISLCGDRYEFWLMGNAAESVLAEAVGDKQTQVHNLCGKLNLGQLARVVDRCEAVISGDTGPMHLAAALGRPQIAIFGGTHPRLGFRPLNSKASVLCADLPCQPCSLHGLEKCPLGHFGCMRQITPQMLVQTLSDLLVQIN